MIIWPYQWVVEAEWVNPVVVVFDNWWSWRHCSNRQPFEKTVSTQLCVKVSLQTSWIYQHFSFHMFKCILSYIQSHKSVAHRLIPKLLNMNKSLTRSTLCEQCSLNMNAKSWVDHLGSIGVRRLGRMIIFPTADIWHWEWGEAWGRGRQNLPGGCASPRSFRG